MKLANSSGVLVRGSTPAAASLGFMSGAFVRNMHDVEFFQALQQFRRKMAGGACAARAIVELAGIPARDLHELLERLRRHRRMDRQQIAHGADQSDGREVLVRIIVELGVQQWAQGNHRRGEHDRVTIRRRFRSDLQANVTARAWPGVGHYGLPDLLGEFRRDQPADDVGRATGRKRHDHADWLRWINRLCKRRRVDRKERRCDQNAATNIARHVSSWCWSLTRLLTPYQRLWVANSPPTGWRVHQPGPGVAALNNG